MNGQELQLCCGYKYNAKYVKDLEFYRWDKRHKDIEIYDDKARYMGSKDPVTGEIYRKGTISQDGRFLRE